MRAKSALLTPFPRRRSLIRLAAAAAVFPLGLNLRAQSNLLRVGSSVDTSGVEKINGLALHQGALAYFTALNRAGGIHGAQVELQVADDKFTPEQAKANALKYVADSSVLAILHPQGTRQSAAMMDAVTTMALVGPNTGNVSLRKKPSPNTFWVRANFDQEMDRLISQAAVLGINRIGLIHSNDPLGQALLAGYKLALGKAKLEPAVIGVTPSTNSMEVESAAQQVAAAKPQMVILGLAGTAPATVRALRKAGSAASVYGLSIASGSFATMGAEGRGLAFSVIVPTPNSPRHALVRRYQTDMAALGKSQETSTTSLEGYVNAMVLAEGLRRAGPAPSRAAVINGLAGLDNYDVGGMQFTFGRTNREGCSFVDIATLGARGQLIA